MDPTTLLHSILAPLVDHPDAIKIVPAETDRVLVLDLHVHPDDVDKVLGVVAEALQDLYRAVGGKAKKRIDIHVVSAHPI